MKHHLRRLPEALGQRTEEMSPANPPPWRKAVGGKSMAAAGANDGMPPAKCLKESLKLQKKLRQLTHRAIAAQEQERATLSHELQDDIAQTLLGINVRLLLLKQAVRGRATVLKSEIASAQRLMVKSATLVRRLAREIENHRPTPNELQVMAILT